jgi:hypothetical protein
MNASLPLFPPKEKFKQLRSIQVPDSANFFQRFDHDWAATDLLFAFGRWTSWL